MTCLTIAYISELVAWHSWKLGYSSQGKTGIMGCLGYLFRDLAREIERWLLCLSLSLSFWSCLAIWWLFHPHIGSITHFSRLWYNLYPYRPMYPWICGSMDSGFRIHLSAWLCIFKCCHLECKIVSTHAAQWHISFKYKKKKRNSPGYANPPIYAKTVLTSCLDYWETRILPGILVCVGFILRGCYMYYY